MHEFVFKIKDQFITVNSWEEVPESFDHVIKFLPEIPPEPHTEEQHKEIAVWPERLKKLLEIERNASNN